MARIYNFLYTAFVYGIFIGLTIYFVYRASKSKTRTNIRLFSVLAVICPAVLAGLRGLSVGTDIHVYVQPLFQRALSNGSMLSFASESGVEFGYSCLVFVGAALFKSVQGVLFLTALMQTVPMYLCCYKMRDQVPMVKSMAVYMLLFYVVGFNIMRQSIAACWIMLAFVYIYKDKYVRGVLLAVIAFLFHSTAVFGFLMLGLSVVFKNVKKKKWLVFWSVLVFALIAFLMRYWKNIIYMMASMGILPYDKAIGYARIFSGRESSYFNIFTISQYLELFFKIILLIVPIAMRKKAEEALYNSTLGVYLIGVLSYLYFVMMFHTSYGYRVSLYAEYFLIFLLPLADSRVKSISSKPRIGVVSKRSLAVWGVVVMNFIVLFVLLGTHGTYPFRFFFE